MANQPEQYARDRTDVRQLAIALGAISVAVAGGIGLVFAVRRLNASNEEVTQFSFPLAKEQAATINAPIEAVEAAWVAWCAQGRLRLKNDYAIRFEPAPGARGTEVHLAGGGSRGTIREILREFKQSLETGEIPLSDGPGLSRPAQPRDIHDASTLAEVR